MKITSLTDGTFELVRCHAKYLTSDFKRKYCFKRFTFVKIRGRPVRTYDCEKCFLNARFRQRKTTKGRIKNSNIRDGYYCLLANEKRVSI